MNDFLDSFLDDYFAESAEHLITVRVAVWRADRKGRICAGRGLAARRARWRAGLTGMG